MDFNSFFNHMHNNQHQPHLSKDVDNSKFYKILGIEKNATSSQIRKAYLSKSIKGSHRHPDRGGDENKFKELSQKTKSVKEANIPTVLDVEDNGSTISISELKELQNDSVAPTKSKRKARNTSGKNSISLDI